MQGKQKKEVFISWPSSLDVSPQIKKKSKEKKSY